ncbi:MAG: toluene tolerance protein [Azoarcus sp.]|jgi:serine/threonine protein kinase|nr:toluene tolerance protein [Azoarcus sp.]MDD2874504.1 toluene tolerance protein [Azoarcus sp.]MDX9838529.1 toluene tolerance protein [Azoarcus sp.]
MKNRIPLQLLGHDEYLGMRAGARVIEQDEYGEKVLLLPDGTYLKLFRRKRVLTSAAWKPYAQRFVENAAALRRLDIPCPQVLKHYRIPAISRDAVHYLPLEGKTIRQVISDGLSEARATALRSQLLEFIKHIHSLGIFFRSAHLGNIVLTPEGTLGLIDISDLKISWFALGPFRRRRNLRHVLRCREDREWLRKSIDWAKLDQ